MAEAPDEGDIVFEFVVLLVFSRRDTFVRFWRERGMEAMRSMGHHNKQPGLLFYSSHETFYFAQMKTFNISSYRKGRIHEPIKRKLF